MILELNKDGKSVEEISEITGVDDFSHIEGWASSGSYAAADTILYNATFFGTNF